MKIRWKIRRIIFYLFPLTFCLFFAGCYNYSQELALNQDGSGTLKVMIEMKQFAPSDDPSSMVEKLERQPCQTPTLNLDEIQEVELLSCVEWIEDYRVHEEALYAFNHVASLSTRGWSYSWKREGDFKVFRTSYDTRENPPTEAQKAGAAEEMSGFQGARFTVNLPKAISEAPGATIDGRTATWDFPWKTVIDEGLTRIDMEAKVKLNFFQRLFGW